MDLSVDEEALLRRARNAVVSTVGSKGSPHISPVWFLWDGQLIRISTPAWTRRVLDLRDNPCIAVCVDDQAAGDYLALYGRAVIVDDARVADLTEPLLLKYLHPEEARARWLRISALADRVVILVQPTALTSRTNVR